MARPKNVIKSVSRNISIPIDLCELMDKELYSELEGKIPFGAQQVFFTKLLRAYFGQKPAEEAPAAIAAPAPTSKAK